MKHRQFEDHNWKGRPLSKLVTGGIPSVPAQIATPIIEEVKYARLGPEIIHPTEAMESIPIVAESIATVEKWPVCDKTFTDVMELIEHSESHYIAQKLPAKLETEKWPICNKSFAISELIKHCEQDHAF